MIKDLFIRQKQFFSNLSLKKKFMSIIIALLFLMLAGFGIGAGSVFQALGYSVYSMVVSLIRQLVVLIPCAYVIGRVTGDVTGVWWAFFIAELVSLMVSALYLRRVNRNVIRTI